MSDESVTKDVGPKRPGYVSSAILMIGFLTKVNVCFTVSRNADFRLSPHYWFGSGVMIFEQL